MRRAALLLIGAILAASPRHASAEPARPVAVVAAENVYGDLANQIGGPDVTVTSILSNPDQDPHLFEASASVARSISAAAVAIYNGADYDPWMEKLLAAARNANRRTVVVAALMGRKPGDNPHLWYDPVAVLAAAAALADTLSATDPAHAIDYRRRLAKFQDSVKPLQAKIAAMRARYAGLPVTATEPVFGYMFEALGMQVRNQGFQVSIMNDTEPSASDVAAFEDDLRTHRVKLLLYNSQASNRVAVRMARLARDAHVPVVGATETEPAGRSYQSWMAGALEAVERALPE